MTRWFAWAGGVLFVTALAVCAWSYFVEFGRPLAIGELGGPSRAGALIRDAALVTLFACHHSLFARAAAKRWLSAVPEPLARSVYVWIASVLLILVCRLWRPIGGEWYDAEGVRAVAHATIQIGGLALIARAVAGLDPLELAGIRQATGAPTRHEPLLMTGPYRWVRHPLYLGWMLLLFGTAHMTADRLAFAAFTSLYLVAAVPWEEQSLRRSFGQAYADYQRQVRWRIVPFVY
ncbi:MAG: methyltransferase family protein [Vicinamibacterales bacterium]